MSSYTYSFCFPMRLRTPEFLSINHVKVEQAWIFFFCTKGIKDIAETKEKLDSTTNETNPEKSTKSRVLILMTVFF